MARVDRKERKGREIDHVGLLTRLEAILGKVADRLAFAGMMVMLLMAFHVCANITTRWVIGRDIETTLELVTYYYMVALVFLPMAFIDRAGGHIVADLFSHFISDRAVKWIDAVFRVMLAMFLAVLFWQSVVDAIERTRHGEAVNSAFGTFDVWPSRWSLPLGFGVACVYTLVLAVKQLVEHFSPKKGS